MNDFIKASDNIKSLGTVKKIDLTPKKSVITRYNNDNSFGKFLWRISVILFLVSILISIFAIIL